MDLIAREYADDEPMSVDHDESHEADDLNRRVPGASTSVAPIAVLKKSPEIKDDVKRKVGVASTSATTFVFTNTPRSLREVKVDVKRKTGDARISEEYSGARNVSDEGIVGSSLASCNQNEDNPFAQRSSQRSRDRPPDSRIAPKRTRNTKRSLINIQYTDSEQPSTSRGTGYMDSEDYGVPLKKKMESKRFHDSTGSISPTCGSDSEQPSVGLRARLRSIDLDSDSDASSKPWRKRLLSRYQQESEDTASASSEEIESRDRLGLNHIEEEVLLLHHNFRMVQSFNRLQSNDVQYDVKFTLKNVEIRAHRLILAAVCAYFKNKYLHKPPTSVAFVHAFREYMPWTLLQLVRYFYSGRIAFTCHNADECFEILNMYGIRVLMDEFMKYLLDNVRADNCHKFKEYIEKYFPQNEAFRVRISTFIRENFPEE